MRADLCIELDVGGAEADEASEEGLVQVAVLLEGHVLDHRGQLVVVPYQNHTLQPAVPILLPLHPHKYIGSVMTPPPDRNMCHGHFGELQAFYSGLNTVKNPLVIFSNYWSQRSFQRASPTVLTAQLLPSSASILMRQYMWRI